MNNVIVDFSKVCGRIKPMHAMGQPPFTGGFLKLDFSHIEHLKNANVPYSRLHDVGGAFGGSRFVDIPNIFRDFDADENLPESYDFVFTDALLAGMAEYGVKPYFRLGVTIENQANYKAYTIHPPKDYAKWARICEHIIRHYNEGWADGYHYGIEYWEIWNEPENGHTIETNQMWTGTAEQYYELYDVTAKHLKECFGDSIKIGGYGACGFYGIYYHPEKYGVDVPKREPDARYDRDVNRVEFLLGFFDYIKAHGSPIDFFSWHSYADVEKTVFMSSYLDMVLEKYGYSGLETHLNEWNNASGNQNHGKSLASAAVTAMMIGMHATNTDMLFYYDSRLIASAYGGLFAPLTYEPVCTYYAFKAYGELYALGGQAELSAEGCYAIAATNGDRCSILISNYSENENLISISGAEGLTAYLIDENNYMISVKTSDNKLTLAPNQVVFMKNY